MADDKPTLIENLPLGRREFVQRLLRTSAFAVPLALGVSTIATRNAHAQQASSTAGGQQSSATGGQQSSTTGGQQSSVLSVAEPASLALLGLGAAGAALAARQRRAAGTDDTERGAD